MTDTLAQFPLSAASRNRAMPRLVAMRTICALMLREMSSRYGRTPGGYIWALLQPVAIILILAFAFALLQRSPSLGTSFILFKATGFLVLMMFTEIGGLVGGAVSYSRALLGYPRVTWLDAVLARFVLNALVKAIVMIIILAGIIHFENIRTLLHWPPILHATILAALMGLGWGLLNCFLFVRFPAWQLAWGIITRPLFLISGVIILYEDMPLLAQRILWYNPILHLTGMMRDGFYPIYRPAYINEVYVWIWILVPAIFGMLLMRRYHRDLLTL